MNSSVQPLKIPITVEMEGWYRVQLINANTGKCRWDSGFFKNVLLINGLNYIGGNSNWMNYCHIGTDNTIPENTQASLLGWLAWTNDRQEQSTGASGSAPYFGFRRVTYRFGKNIGLENQNLNEVGVGWSSATGNNLISRALILDPVTQLPTTVTPLVDEYVDITYELRYYAPENDVIGPQVVLGGVTYDTVTRAANVTGLNWHQWIGTAIGAYCPYNSSWAAFDGELGTVIQSPSGISADADNNTATNLTYANNSYERVMYKGVNSEGWNLPGGAIRSLRIQTTAGDYQTRLGAVSTDDPLPKTDIHRMGLSWVISWAERP